MDQNKTKIQQVVDILTQKGWSDEKISQMLQEMGQMVFNKFYHEAMSNFTDDDIAQIEACVNEEEMNQKIKELYTLRTGKDADEQSRLFYDTFAQGFLDEYEKNPDSI